MRRRVVGRMDEFPPKNAQELFDETARECEDVKHPLVLLSNLLPKKSPTLASKKNISDVPIRDYLRGRCAAGISTNEDDVYYAFPSRYRRGDCLRMLKSFHQTYSASTELKVHHGLWVLSVKGSVQE